MSIDGCRRRRRSRSRWNGSFEYGEFNVAEEVVLRLEAHEVPFIVVFMINDVGAFNADMVACLFGDRRCLTILTLLATTEIGAFNAGTVALTVLLPTVCVLTVASSFVCHEWVDLLR